jgi:hypothetical protein
MADKGALLIAWILADNHLVRPADLVHDIEQERLVQRQVGRFFCQGRPSASPSWWQGHTVPYLAANHKTGSAMTVGVAARVCSALKRTIVSLDCVGEPTSAVVLADRQCMVTSMNNLAAREPHHMKHNFVQPPRPSQPWIEAPETLWPKLPSLFKTPLLRSIVVLRDPINYVVSHFFYHLNGNEDGNLQVRPSDRNLSMGMLPLLKDWLAMERDPSLIFEMTEHTPAAIFTQHQALDNIALR